MRKHHERRSQQGGGTSRIRTKSHRAAADAHGKNDHAKGKEYSSQAQAAFAECAHSFAKPRTRRASSRSNVATGSRRIMSASPIKISLKRSFSFLGLKRSFSFLMKNAVSLLQRTPTGFSRDARWPGYEVKMSINPMQRISRCSCEQSSPHHCEPNLRMSFLSSKA